jgi:dienelactone hydrolase
MNRNPGARIVALCALAGATLLTACTAALKLTPNDANVVLAQQTLRAPDPGQPGSYDVLTLYYGNGTDKNRAEYRDSVSITTETVDASKMVSLGGSADERNGYWGFTPKEMPLNARVWYPDGSGPFPLVLVVHGNHNMRDFSDPGYDYLGELLASRGFILASVDENFINGGIRGENDARGWFLLKHVEAFKGFNEESGNPFEGKVDMGNIVLMGHSRGGEAVANAAAFNKLSNYPDDASLEFDFNYDIKGIVSIAPVDGQYLPTGRNVVVEDMSYLTFHGSHDGDVTSFHGLRIYDRLKFNDPEVFNFKSAIYVYRANHGQWNTVWGSHDGGPRSARTLDLRGLIPQEDQRRFAEIYVSAFLDIVLRGNKEYLPIFRDHRVIGEWLPETMYITRFETSAFRPLATFEEDIDVTRGTEHGVRLRGDSLSTWKEETLALRSSNRANTSASQDNQAVTVGWNNRIAGPDTTRRGPPATYTVEFPSDVAARWALGESHTLDFMLGPTNAMPGPRRDPDSDTTATNDDEEGPRGGRGGGGDDDEEDEKPPVDLSIEVEDAAGRTSKVILSDYGAIRRPLESWVMRRADQERERFSDHFELILQTYSIPLGDFTAENPALDLRQLTAIRFVFDLAVSGEVSIDQIGISRLDPAFLSARAER